MEFLADSAPKKQTLLSMLISLVNRPMFALSILIHVGLMSIPLPESAQPAAAEEEEQAETESLGDLAEINLAAAPLVEATPLPVPSLEATPTPVVTIAPTIAADLSRAPRPPKKIEATPEVRSIPVPKPVPIATPTPIATPSPVKSPVVSETPAQGGSSTTITATPIAAPPPPPPAATPAPTAAPVPEIAIADPNSGISIEDLRTQLANFRATLPESDSDRVYPSQLTQPGSFFKAAVVGQDIASNTDCLETIVYCWWQPRETPRAVLPKIQKQEAFANLTFQEVTGGYGGGKLYNLVNKNTGQPTTLYIGLPGAKGATGTGTLVVFWVSNPNP